MHLILIKIYFSSIIIPDTHWKLNIVQNINYFKRFLVLNKKYRELFQIILYLFKKKIIWKVQII